MATNIVRVDKSQRYWIRTGQLKERSEVIQDNLLMTVPFDGSDVGFYSERNLLDDSVWTIGTSGSQGNFTANGTSSENEIISRSTPYGYADAVWASLGNDSTSGPDGGWNNYNNTIDRTKTYRLSVWVRRENTGSGSGGFYLGTQGNTVWGLGTTTKQGNPYLFSGLLISEIPEMVDNWILFVGFIHPTTYGGGTSSNNGAYDINGNLIYSGTDFQWANDATVGGHRTYLYYSTKTDERIYWYAPRMEQVENTGNIDELIRSEYNILKSTTNTNTYFYIHGAGISDPVTNEVNNPTGDDGAGIPGDYTPGWDTSLHSRATTVSFWNNGYNGSVTNPSVGYHAQWVYEGPDGSPCMKFIDLNSQFGYTHRWLGISQGIVSNISSKGWGTGTVLTVSWDQKVNTLGKISRVGFYHTEGGGATFGTAIFERTNTKIYTWERMTATYTITASWDSTSYLRLYYYGYFGDEGILWIDNVQIEEENHATPFVDGNRLSSSNLKYNIPNNLTTLTIVGKFYPYTPWEDGNSYARTTNGATLFRVNDTTNTGDAALRYYLSGGVTSFPYIDPTGYWGTSHIHQTYTVNAEEVVYYVIRRYSTTFQVQLYQNGWKTAHTLTVPSDAEINEIEFGQVPTIWNGEQQGFSVFEKQLTTAEEENIINVQLSMRSDGDVVPGDFLLETEENIYPNAELLTTTYGASSGFGTVTKESTAEDGDYHQIVASNVTGSIWRAYDLSILENGETYIFSGKFWFSAGNNFNYRPLVFEQVSSIIINSPSISTLPTEEWVDVFTIAIADSDNNRVLIYPSAGGGNYSGTVKWKNIVLRKATASDFNVKNKILSVGNLDEGV